MTRPVRWASLSKRKECVSIITHKKEKINAVVVRPDSKPYSTWISPDLKNLQRFVGGYIETVTVWSGYGVVICNENGRILGLPECCEIDGIDFVGNVIIVGKRDGELDDINQPFPLVRDMIRLKGDQRKNEDV